MSVEPSKEQKFPTGTLVFGLILMLVALASLSRTVFNWQFDAPLFFIGLVAVSGIVMIVTGIASARKPRTKNSNTPQL